LHNIFCTDKGLVKAGIVDKVKTLIEDAKLPTDMYEDCQPEPPISIIEAISAKVKVNGYDLLIGIGGGSNMDATKFDLLTVPPAENPSTFAFGLPK
jgi:alcohol dehydrogenase class IV